MKKKKLVIIGGTKFVGLELINHLKDYETHVLSRKLILQDEVNSKVLDRKNKQELSIAIHKIQPEIILDMICYDEKDAVDMIAIIEDLSSVQHYIMISTFFIYNYSDKYEQFDELNIDMIMDNYTKNKYLAERQIFNSNIFDKTTIVRFPFIFSYDDYTKRFQYMIENTLKGQKVKVDDFQCSFITKVDAAKSLLKLLKLQPQEFIDISNRGCITLKEIYSLIADMYEVDVNFVDSERDVYQIKKNICLRSDKLSSFNIPTIDQAINNELKNYIKEYLK